MKAAHVSESKNCEILMLTTADRRFETKVKCPIGRASFWVKFPTVRSLTRVKCPGITRGGMGGFGIDWYINSRSKRLLNLGFQLSVESNQAITLVLFWLWFYYSLRLAEKSRSVLVFRHSIETCSRANVLLQDEAWKRVNKKK